MKVRIGIDVGGTFTDAAVVSDDTFELVGSVKVPTTHDAPEGVAAGIVQALRKAMADFGIDPRDVSFIAHGTTQATNALLEGDVAKVGVLTIGRGLEGIKAKGDTAIGDIELAARKYLRTEGRYVDAAGSGSAAEFAKAMAEAIVALRGEGCRSLVAAEAFSVDDPRGEDLALETCASLGMPGTATKDVSKLYGLRVRTRTAVVNASILPKMLEAADMTEASIKRAGIASPLMVMRCDGGVMTIDEVRRRPILTILSGPAAGVAGALMYEKLTDGIFFEVGGTSTDISCVKDGRVMVRYAEVGGHKTYLNSLDVRTVGIGGGSMMRLRDGKLVDVGPRSVHITGLEYEVYSDPELIRDPELATTSPKPGDPEYAYVRCSNGRNFALSLAGAANIAGYVPEGDYARGSVEAARKAWKPLADAMGMSVERVAARALELSAAKNSAVARELIKDYRMDPRTTTFIGGGGGASAVVPHLAESMGCSFRIARNAPVISTIGVALAMVRDMVERTVPNPTEEDILAARREAELLAIKSGAAPGCVEVSVEVDSQRNLLRAIATGATELRTKGRGSAALPVADLLAIVAESLGTASAALKIAAEGDGMLAVQAEREERRLFGLVRKRTRPLRLIDDEGVIRLRKSDADVRPATAAEWEAKTSALIEELTEYNDGGRQLPNLYIAAGKRIINLSGLASEAQMLSLAAVELAAAKPDERLVLVGTRRGES